jgi:DNA-binding CsgD family transcriptional regulator
MDASIAEMIQKVSASRLGYIICQPKTSEIKYRINFNTEAYRILSYHPLFSKTDTHAHFSRICAKWKRTFDERLKWKEESGRRESSTGSFVELFKSGKRTYVVRALVLYEDRGRSLQNSQIMFILERLHNDLLNIHRIAREWHLTQREQKLIQLVFAGMSNKEISQELRLTLDTIKTYLKNLMKKIGVNSRAGLIAHVLIDKHPK